MQSELRLRLTAGGSYQLGEHVATWRHRLNDEKIIDLIFRGKSFEISREGSGPNGRPRMFINGVRTADGKLFQGRSLLELIRKLDLYFDDLIEIPSQLRRIERKLDRVLAGGRPRPSTKLCLASVTATWTQERYIPYGALGGFARVPIPLIPVSNTMAAGEYRLLQVILFCAQGSGLLTAGKKRLAKLANIAESDFYRFRDSLHNRQIIRPTGRILKYGIKEYEVLTHPWLCDVGSLPKGGEKTAKGEEICSTGGRTVLPLKTIKKILTDQTINKKAALNRPQAARMEEELLRRLRECCPDQEMERNGGGWRKWAREDPRSLASAIDDLEVRKDNYHLCGVNNSAAYINERYHFYHRKNRRSDKGMAELSPDKSLSELVRESISQCDIQSKQPARSS
jgi:hypothetical protein